MLKRVATALVLLLTLPACGGDEDAPAPAPPYGAEVAPEQSIEPELRASLEEEEVTRISLTEATRLAAKGDRRAIEPLQHELANADDELHRLVAARHLMKLKAASAVPVLVGEIDRLSESKRTDETARLLRRNLVRALEEITGVRHDARYDPTESIQRWTQWYDARSSASPR